MVIFSLGSRDGWLIFVTCVVDLEPRDSGPRKENDSRHGLPAVFGGRDVNLSGAAYLSRDWRHLKLAMTVPTFL